MSAAESLGMSRLQGYVHVVLPQALAAIIPAFVNSLLSTFMDTSLVTVVSMQDLFGSLRLALGDPQWREFFGVGYIFLLFPYHVRLQPVAGKKDQGRAGRIGPAGLGTESGAWRN